MNKLAITVLTRGYNNIEQYSSLINRNLLIYENIISKLDFSVDMIIFHEGNISKIHQDYISEKSQQFLIFKNVKECGNKQAFNDDKNIFNYDLCPPTPLSSHFPLGYKHMCHFWSIDFLEYLKEYDIIIRIDEDCFVKKFDVNILKDMIDNDIYFASPEFQEQDDSRVIVGLEKLLNEFLLEKNLQPIKNFNEIRCPYTNFMITNISFLRNNKLIMDMLEKIDGCHGIYSNRWGDLPIWGMILTTLVLEKHYREYTSISYYHTSHNKQIN